MRTGTTIQARNQFHCGIIKSMTYAPNGNKYHFKDGKVFNVVLGQKGKGGFDGFANGIEWDLEEL